MESEEMAKEFVGKYFIDKYNLDSELSYTRVTHIYRVNGVKRIEHGSTPFKLLCTSMSICYDEMKKTGEKVLIEAKISEMEMGGFGNTFSNMDETDTDTWEKTAIELMSIVSTKAYVYTDLEHYCSDCKNYETENCRFCCKRGEEKPTFYEKK